MAELVPTPIRQPNNLASKSSTTELTVPCEPVKKKSVLDRLKEKTTSALCNQVTNKQKSLEGVRREIKIYLNVGEMNQNPETVKVMLKETLYKLNIDDPVKRVWVVSTQSEGTVWCDASNLAVGVSVKIGRKHVEDGSLLRWQYH